MIKWSVGTQVGGIWIVCRNLVLRAKQFCGKPSRKPGKLASQILHSFIGSWSFAGINGKQDVGVSLQSMTLDALQFPECLYPQIVNNSRDFFVSLKIKRGTIGISHALATVIAISIQTKTSTAAKQSMMSTQLVKKRQKTSIDLFPKLLDTTLPISCSGIFWAKTTNSSGTS